MEELVVLRLVQNAAELRVLEVLLRSVMHCLLGEDANPNWRLVEFVELPDQCFASEDEMSDFRVWESCAVGLELLHNERKQVFGLDAIRPHGRMTAGPYHA